MIEPWFSSDLGRWFSLLSLLALLSLLEPFAQKGRHRPVVMSAYGVSVAVGVVLLAAATFAALVGQPTHVVRPLVLGGFITAFVFVGAFAQMRRTYTEAEFRRTVAGDM
jgi:hypothetical protein